MRKGEAMSDILFLVQLPPPVHGASIMNQRIIDIVKEDGSFTYDVVKLNYAFDFKSMHSPNYKKVAYALKVYLKFICNLIFRRPRFIYIAFAPFGLGFYRDFIISMISKVLGCKVKLHLHGTGLSLTKSSVKIWLLKKLFSSCDLILLSKSLYHDVSPFVGLDRVSYVSNSVDTPDICEQRLDEVVGFLYVANLDERKGVLKAVEVFAEYLKLNKYATLSIVGADTVSMTKSKLLQIITSDYPETIGNINILGALYGKVKQNVYESANIFIYPTEHDAAPLVVLEALSYGLPVVCSNQGALNDMVTNGSDGFIINEFDSKAYLESIEKISSSYAVFSASARNAHLKRDSITVLSKKIKVLFCE